MFTTKTKLIQDICTSMSIFCEIITTKSIFLFKPFDPILYSQCLLLFHIEIMLKSLQSIMLYVFYFFSTSSRLGQLGLCTVFVHRLNMSGHMLVIRPDACNVVSSLRDFLAMVSRAVRFS